MKKVSAIIVNYNTRDILRDCIKNLDGKYPNLELIIVDNSSPDDSAKMIEEEFPSSKFPWLKLIKATNNGLAASSNIGLENATGEYLLYMGADAFPKENTITGMVEWLEEHPKVGIATSKLVQRNNKIDMDAHRGFPYPWVALTHFTGLDSIFPKSKLFNSYFKAYEDMDEPHEIDLCISHFMLIKKEVFDQIGKWDTDFFLYGEDVDFCWRAKQAGWQIYYLPAWTTVHYKGTSIGVRASSQDVTTASPETKLKMHKTSANAMKIFYEKHWKNRYPKALTGLIFLAIDTIAYIRTIKIKAQLKNSQK